MKKFDMKRRNENISAVQLGCNPFSYLWSIIKSERLFDFLYPVLGFTGIIISLFHFKTLSDTDKCLVKVAFLINLTLLFRSKLDCFIKGKNAFLFWTYFIIYNSIFVFFAYMTTIPFLLGTKYGTQYHWLAYLTIIFHFFVLLYDTFDYISNIKLNIFNLFLIISIPLVLSIASGYLESNHWTFITLLLNLIVNNINKEIFYSFVSENIKWGKKNEIHLSFYKFLVHGYSLSLYIAIIFLDSSLLSSNTGSSVKDLAIIPVLQKMSVGSVRIIISGFIALFIMLVSGYVISKIGRLMPVEVKTRRYPKKRRRK